RWLPPAARDRGRLRLPPRRPPLPPSRAPGLGLARVASVLESLDMDAAGWGTPRPVLTQSSASSGAAPLRSPAELALAWCPPSVRCAERHAVGPGSLMPRTDYSVGEGSVEASLLSRPRVIRRSSMRPMK